MILSRLRETGNKMLHKSLPSYPRESNFVLLLYSICEYSEHPEPCDEFQVSDVKHRTLG